ncbi:uncharacterized protein cubi_01118 [Cryptosporidium ubiquitum]|uniref:Uncharacterized protein n=1 Tax=Cryptosporidium ubiquitum TaxID=857276 RepID=A0A1J4MJ38_9CRYT|nr:uncharacterized protein cubi_01118 [Cryptosporidium ubiquitum]OII74274.1 hypothetical protein cubi_01118 [Cryptosporidium ubiquitum]
MESIHIFSGNVPAIVCTYFNQIYSNQSNISNFNSKESEKNEKNSFEHGSIAIFDSNYNQNKFFGFCGESGGCLDSKHSFNQNGTILDHANDKNLTFSSNMRDLTKHSPWNGRIDVFEQSNNHIEYSDNFNLIFFLKRLLGDKNIHNKIPNKWNYSNPNSANGLLNNSYSLNVKNSRFESAEILESIRHKLENSDQNRIIYLSTEVDSAYSNISSEILEFLDEETPHSYKPSLSLLINENENKSINNLNLNKILNFSNTKFLIDQSKFCDDIWLIDLNHIDSLAQRNSNTNFNPLVTLAFIIDQISATMKDLNNTYINPLSTIGRSVSHPFRNIAVFNSYKAGNDSNKTSCVVGAKFESLCSNYFLDICQSGYFGLDLLEKSEIISIINGNPYIFGNETEKMIDFLSINTRKIIHSNAKKILNLYI